MKQTALIASIALASWVSTAIPRAQEPMSTAGLRPLVETAVAQSGGDPVKALAALDRVVSEKWGDVEREPIWLIPRTVPEVWADLMSPYVRYRAEIEGHLRKREPIDGVELTNEVTVEISPNTIDAPDFVSVVVERDGHEVKPLRIGLMEHRFETRANTANQAHAGTVTFPISAFAPGATVVVSLVPDFGPRRVTTLSPQQLLSLK